MDISTLGLNELYELIKSVEEALPNRIRVEKAPTSLLEFAKCMIPDYKTPPHIKLLAERLEDVAAGRIRRLMVLMPPRSGKRAALNTPVLTPTGWRKHGDLRVGDAVFDINGQSANITYVSPVDLGDLRVNFTNGDSVDVHNGHLWTVYDRNCQKWKTVDTATMVSTKLWNPEKGIRGSRARWQLPDQRGVEFPEKFLMMEPYALGVWLGDGNRQCARIDMAACDEAVWRRVESLGYEISRETPHAQTGVMLIYFSDAGPRRIGRFQGELRKLGVIGNKHIPEIYLRSSRQQRLQLLAGLMDMDGNIDKTDRCRIATTSPALRDGIYDLCTTLGYRPYVTETPPKLSTSGIQGRLPVYGICFQPFEEIPVSLDRRRPKSYQKRRRVAIDSIERIAPFECSCIKIDRDDGLYLVGKTLIPTHNTQLISKIFPAFYMGLYPQRSVICSTYGQELSDDMGRSVKNIIQTPIFHDIFPNAIMARDSASIRRFDIVDMAAKTTKKGQYFAVGVGSSITGRGGDLILVDDPIKDAAEADSALQRHNIIEWYKTTLYTRLMPNAAMVVVQTRWHQNDLAGYILENKVEPWTVITLPALAEENDILGRKLGEALWPEAFSAAELLRTRQLEGPRHWNALYQQRPTAESGNIIKRDWWVPWTERDPPKMEYIIQAYDTANAEGKDNDFTAVSTWGVFRIDGIPHVMLISVYNKKRDYQLMRREVTHLYNHYQPDQAVCEYKQSGITLVQDLRRAGIPLLKFNPDSDKVARAHAVVPFFESGRVHYPAGKWWAEAMVDQCASFPFGKHDDMVDSACLALLRLKQGFLLHARGDPYADETDADEEDQMREERRQGYW